MNYYKNQIQNLLDTQCLQGVYSLKIMGPINEHNQTNWLTLNLESIPAIQASLSQLDTKLKDKKI